MSREVPSRPRRSAILVVQDDRGRVLLVRQRAGPFAGEWLLPGGGLEEGESFEDGLRREIREETCLEVQDTRLIARYDVKTQWPGAPARPMRVHLFAGVVRGEPRVGMDGEPVEWRAVRADAAHPVLLQELRDAGAIDVPETTILAGLDARGIRMTRIDDATPD